MSTENIYQYNKNFKKLETSSDKQSPHHVEIRVLNLCTFCYIITRVILYYKPSSNGIILLKNKNIILVNKG